jgi:hypothetical protein
MAITRTALGAACTADDLKLRVASSAGATYNGLVQVGDEFMNCVSVDSATQISVRSRGSQGGRAKAHANLAPVAFGLGADFADTPPGSASPTSADWDVRELAVEASFDVLAIKSNTEVIITKATALALVLGSPAQGVDGVELRFLSGNAVAHVITLTPAIGGKVSATFTAGGASITFRAQNGAWVIVSSGNVTLA